MARPNVTVTSAIGIVPQLKFEDLFVWDVQQQSYVRTSRYHVVDVSVEANTVTVVVDFGHVKHQYNFELMA